MAGGGAVTGVKAAGPAISKGQEYFAFGLITSLFFLWGFSYGLLDVLNKHFQTFFGITKLQSTLLQVAYFGAYIVFSPVVGIVISRFGYKKGIYLGLTLYAVGALMFWPSAHFEKYGGFVGAAFIIACGLATLEVCANSYVTVLGSPEQAAFRLNFSQSFNGLASFVGPLIASKYFFGDGNTDGGLGTVQYVYLAVACLGAAVMVLFFFAKLPEITDEDMDMSQAAKGFTDDRPLWKRKHTIFGFLTQFCYVGAQVAVASFVINYLTDKHDYTDSKASQMFSYMQITFMVGRFASTPLMKYFSVPMITLIYGTMCSIFSLVAAFTGGKAGLASLFIIFFFESCIYPNVFTMATSRLGVYTKRGASLVVMGVGGGAAFPPLQGALADAKTSQLSYVIPFLGFFTVTLYSGAMMIYESRMPKENLESGSNALAYTGSKEEVEVEKLEAPAHRF